METEEREDDFFIHEDFPHLELMEEMGIAYEELSPECQQKIKTFRKFYEEAWIDGALTKPELDELKILSYKICEQIKKDSPKKGAEGAAVVSTIAGIISGFFGVKIFRK